MLVVVPTPKYLNVDLSESLRRKQDEMRKTKLIKEGQYESYLKKQEIREDKLMDIKLAKMKNKQGLDI